MNAEQIRRGARATKRIVRNTNQEDVEIALLGKLTGSDPFNVRGKPGWVHTRLRLSNGAMATPAARNDAGVPFILNLKVILEREYYLDGSFVYVVTGVSRRADLAYGQPPPSNGIPPHTHDTRYYTKAEHLSTSAGAADAGKPAVLDAGGKWDASLIDSEDIADIVGAMVTGNTETDVAVTYQDSDNTLDFVVSPTLVADRIHAATDKATPVDADELGLADSAASWVLKKLTWANLKATLKTYFDTLYFVVAGKSGGQTAYGGTDSGDDLTLQSTSHATKGDLFLLDNAINFGDGLSTLAVRFNGAAGQVRDFIFRSGGVNRWIIRINANAESGSNAGSNFELNSRADDGSALAAVMAADRATGYVGFGAAAGVIEAKVHVIQPTVGQNVLKLQSTTGGDDPTQDFLQARGLTTNNTITTIVNIAIPASHACFLDAYVVARRTGGTAGTAEDCAAYIIRALANQVAGAANIVAQSQTVIGESQAAWDCVFDANSTNVRIRVTGATNNNITWHAHIFHRYLSS